MLVPNDTITFCLSAAGGLMLSTLWFIGAGMFQIHAGRPAAAETRLTWGFIALLSAGAFLIAALNQV